MSFSALSAGDRELVDAARSLSEDMRGTLVRSIRLLADSSGRETHPTALKLAVGKSYSPQERVRLELKGLERDFARRRELLEGCIGTSEVVELLKLTPQGVRQRIKQQKLLAILDGGDYQFPLAQFDACGPNGVLEGLDKVLKAMTVSDYARLNWLATPNPIFGDATPFEALRTGEKDRVTAAAFAINLI